MTQTKSPRPKDRKRSHQNADWKQPCGSKRKKRFQMDGKPCGQGGRGKSKRRRRRRKRKSPALRHPLVSLTQMCQSLDDPRVNRRRRHLLVDIVASAMCAVIAGADCWKDIHAWAKLHQDWLGRFLILPNGIPSRDTYRRVLSAVHGEQLQRCFTDWIAAWWRQSRRKHINIDGKTLRGSRDSLAKLGPLHVVSAWASEQRVTLGQRSVDGKSNEITAIPELLRMLELKGAMVTIDAMGCQKAIARQIRQQQGHFALAVKENQPSLYASIAQRFDPVVDSENADGQADACEQFERQRGRDEWRLHYVLPADRSLHQGQWPEVRAIGAVFTYTIREGGREIHDVRYYIISRKLTAKEFATAARGHWGIENSLHWVLDVTFGEDACRIRDRAGAANFSWLRRIAISLLKREPTKQDTVRAKRREAGWSVEYLEKVLMAASDEN